MLYLLIKPSSSNCNMNCRYCFYEDVSENRQIKSYGNMSLKTLENLVKQAFAFESSECTFAFQGGEPTLIGLDFYHALLHYVQIYNERNISVHYSIQTNGYLIDENWAKFFANNRFLVGISLDGDKQQHDSYRIDNKLNGTFQKVMNAISLFNQYQVDYSILTVVTNSLTERVDEVYDFFKENNFYYQQYIPCIDAFGEERKLEEFSLSPERYGEFLIQLFDKWYSDLRKGEAPSIRYFDNLILIMRNQPPESCGMTGRCSIQNVVEANGNVYPCDFYVLDSYLLGNIKNQSFHEIYENRKKSRFIEDSFLREEGCIKCNYFPICRGGCRRYREMYQDNPNGRNYFCSSYKQFFDYAYEKLLEISYKFV